MVFFKRATKVLTTRLFSLFSSAGTHQERMGLSQIVVLCSLVLSGCAGGPTKSYEQEPVFAKDKTVLSENVVLIDARPAFQHSIAHPAGAIGMAWQDFSQKTPPFEGVLEKDLFFHARRLARMGITPDTPVIILGNGQQGQGEEGRLAWTLKVMGIKNIQIAHIDHFRFESSTAEAPPRKPQPIWKPEVLDSWEISRQEFDQLILQPRVLPDSPVLLDVRTVEEYLGKKGPPLKIDYNAINVPWTEFITSQGEPNQAVVAKLAALGIDKNRQIILIDWQGVRSGLACFVLRDLGFSASNFSGGYYLLESQF